MPFAPLAPTIHFENLNAPDTPTGKRTYIIYYIPGNPGLIEYYRIFLTHLYGLLTSNLESSGRKRGRDVEVLIHGRSLAGFETSGIDDGVVNDGIGPPYDVEHQIVRSENAVKDVAKRARKGGRYDVRIILMGHSLGTYVSMEVLRRLRTASAKDRNGEGDGVRVIGAVCLFTTIMNLKGSPSGRKVSWLISLPHFSLIASLFVKTLTLFMPTNILSLLICLLMDFPRNSSHITASFIKSPYGVRQALHMAHDEMQTITTDKWDDEIWGAAHPPLHPHPRPVLRFLFAASDHWVANETRDELIKARGMNGNEDEPWKPKMEVDEKEGWPHGFCIKHSIPVAERVRGYIEDIIEADLANS
ncbi:hypothetical protein CC78DRAFT_493357 [Lojkania enalia]|uniref:Lipid droplet-associated hydrolase n=1 Tax=Lojkania enalia TaxID=147567 RepID=A0A9P4KCW3_9PLEO|nr:hypothetical protein CC78DRAFT_493357 [Didymosphaeria enalia]